MGSRFRCSLVKVILITSVPPLSTEANHIYDRPQADLNLAAYVNGCPSRCCQSAGVRITPRGADQIPTGPERQTLSGRGPNVSIARSFFEIDCHLNLCQPFFVQFRRRQQPLVGSAVVRQGRLKFANGASCVRISGIFFPENRFWSPGWGLPLPCFPTPLDRCS